MAYSNKTSKLELPNHIISTIFLNRFREFWMVVKSQPQGNDRLRVNIDAIGKGMQKAPLQGFSPSPIITHLCLRANHKAATQNR